MADLQQPDRLGIEARERMEARTLGRRAVVPVGYSDFSPEWPIREGAQSVELSDSSRRGGGGSHRSGCGWTVQ